MNKRLKQAITGSCAVIAAFVLAAALATAGCSSAQSQSMGQKMDYEDKIFDTSYVHSVDITMSADDWEDLNAHAEEKTKYDASITIDGETYDDVTVATKGSMSLLMAASYKTGRYSLKVRFTHKGEGETYYGLDCLDLNANSSDASQMKDYLAYEMFRTMDVPAPLVSYAWVTVNGEDYGLLIAIEEMKDSCLQRNFSNEGQLYEGKSSETTEHNAAAKEEVSSGVELASSNMTEMTAALNPYTSGADLRYTDDNISSYPDLFDNAVTDATEEDEQRVVTALKSLSEGDVENSVNTDEVMRYFAVQNFTCNYDSYTGALDHNFYVYEKDGKLSMLPWDYDYADSMCTNANAPEQRRLTTTHEDCDIDNPLTVPEDSRPMWTWITANDTYLQQYHKYCSQLVSDCVDSGWAADEIDRINGMIRSYIEKDPSVTYSLDEYDAAVTDLAEFFKLRGENITEQLKIE